MRFLFPPLAGRRFARYTVVAAFASVLLALPPEPLAADTDAPTSPGSAQVRGVLEALYDAMGGRSAFDSLPTLRLTFAYSSLDTTRSSRTHWWDKSGGRYRIQGVNRTGQSFVILFNTETRDGDAWLNGRQLTGEDEAAQLKRGYGLFINDTYWLLMPFKLDDHGVTVVADGEASVDGAACDRLKVTFDHVGLTPGDTYWAYIDRATHRMVRWGFILEDEAGPDAVETQWDWVDWTPVGPLVLSSTRVKPADAERSIIRFDNLEAGATWPDSIFTSPMPLRF